MAVEKDSRVDAKAVPLVAAKTAEDNGAAQDTESEHQNRTGLKASCTSLAWAAAVEEQLVGKARLRAMVLEAKMFVS